MSRMYLVSLLTLASVFAWASCASPNTEKPQEQEVAPVPDWIWNRGEAEAGEKIELQLTFAVHAELASARLWAAADDVMEIRVNEELVAESTEWRVPVELDIVSRLDVGPQVLSVWAANNVGPGGFCAELVLNYADGRSERHASGPAWRVRLADSDAAWVAATSIAPLGSEPWGALEEARAPSFSLPTAGSDIDVPEGFDVECIYAVSRARQGSWVSLTHDGHGRLIASDQYGDLYRITLSAPSDRGSPFVERLDVQLGEAHGLLHAFGALYVVVNAGGSYESGLYRLREKADGSYGEPEQLKVFKGNGEHGPHAIVLGPNGESLYIIAGNHTDLPQVDLSQVPMLWAEDRLGPHLNDPNGHAVGIEAPGGWVCRTDPDGKVWELVAMGFRNAYDIAFNADGELFTYDSDMEWDVGMPWYRPTRVLHVAHGAEFGWRTGTGKWPVSHPDSLPSAVDLGLASPTGVLFGTGTSFPAPWRETLFVADWAYGTLHAVHLEDRGGSYGGTSEPFLSGKALPLTDLATTGDGALYFTTGGRRAQSGLYRVRWTGAVRPASLASASSERDVDREQMEKRLVLRTFEGLRREGVISSVPAQAMFANLDSQDRYERYRYRALIEGQSVASWRDIALAEERPNARIEAALALVRADEELSAEELYARIATWSFEEMEPSRLLAALRVAELSLIRMDDAAPHALATLGTRLAGMLPTTEDRVNLELVRILAHLQVPETASLGVDLLQSASSQEVGIELALVLSQLRAGWNADTKARYLAWFVDTAAGIEGGHSSKKYIRKIREMAHESLGVALPPESDEPEPAPVALEAKYDWKVAELFSLWDRSQTERSLERGAELYSKATCATCHRFGKDGGSQGPDLTGVASRFSVRDILEALVEPSRTVSDQYRDLELWKENGDVVVGRLEDEVDGNYVMRTGLMDERVTVPVDDVTEKREHALSRMPEDLLDPFDEEEVLDLLAFLLQ